jgi:hypothetical protein
VKNVTKVREHVISGAIDMLERLRLRLAYPEPDLEILKHLERPQQFDLAELVARCVMEQLGYSNGDPKDPRFDKTRRALNEQLNKGPRRLTATTMRGDDDAQA